jgi:transcriptional regulator with XRE-family HTH domain
MRTFCKRNLRTDFQARVALGARMTDSDIPLRLKALREASGLSIRALAHRLGMSSSGYAHYENPARFKDQFLPMQLTLDLARIMAPMSVSGDHVMGLAGSTAQLVPAGTEPAGFAEDSARPWAPNAPDKAALAEAIHALAPQAMNPGTFQMARAIPELGLLAGDILIVDRKRLPEAGELAIANAQTDHGTLATVVGRFLPPLLFTAESLTQGTILDVTTGAVAVYHPIVASFRTFVRRS